MASPALGGGLGPCVLPGYVWLEVDKVLHVWMALSALTWMPSEFLALPEWLCTPAATRWIG